MIGVCDVNMSHITVTIQWQTEKIDDDDDDKDFGDFFP